jgi:hypothetical protein
MLKRVVKMPYAQDQGEAFEAAYLALAASYMEKAKFDLAQVGPRPWVAALCFCWVTLVFGLFLQCNGLYLIVPTCLTLNAPLFLRHRRRLLRLLLLLCLFLLQDLCKRCLQYNASSAQAHDTLGAILERECAYKDAAECYEKAWRFAHMGSAATGYLLAFNYLKVKARNGSVL